MSFNETGPPEEAVKRRASRLPFPVVGIGASAGGLEAVSGLLAALPAAPDMAFLLVQHLHPDHESLLAEILATKAPMPVTEVEDGETVARNHVYVIPPNTSLSIADGRLWLSGRQSAHGKHAPIDILFGSLAEDQAQNSIGIILSGAGSDGAQGIEAIHRAGGVTFAEDPRIARFPHMPRAAIETGCVDFVLPPAALAEALLRVRQQHEKSGRAGSPFETVVAEDPKSLERIFQRLHTERGLDFSHYKRSTIDRRLARRMILNSIAGLSDYAEFLAENPSETEALAQDLLIRTTRFFRDPATFSGLVETVFPRLVQDRSPTDPVRIWVPGCASGEEVYSIAISLLEYLSERTKASPPQIFGTDVSDVAIDQARSGVFPQSIEDHVSSERLQRFFTKRDSRYRIAPSVRELCVFARHDVTSDPPMSQMDVVVCQNLLIYFDVVLQRQVVPCFHYSLKPRGFLVLGPSEAIGAFTDLFALVDKRCKIYQRLDASGRVGYGLRMGARRPPTALRGAPIATLPPPLTDTEHLQRETEKLLLASFTPPCVLISEGFDVIYFHGETSRFLEHARGPASLNLKTLAGPWLLVEIDAAIQQARADGAPARRDCRTIEANGPARDISLTVVPVKLPNTEAAYYLVLFADAPWHSEKPRPAGWWTEWWTKLLGPGGPPPESDGNDQIDRLQNEFKSVREYLQVIIAENEKTVADLKSTHEELLSANEEFQSTNEELETAKEELQSTNEELITTNEELRHRNLELGELNELLTRSRDYAEAVIETLRQPLLVLDAELRVARANRAFFACFATTAGETERRIIYDLGNGQWNIPELRKVLEVTLRESIEFRDFEVSHIFPDIGEKTMVLNARRLTGDPQRTDWILLAMEDITARVQVERAVVAEKERYWITLASIGEGVITANAAGQVEYMNVAAERYTGWTGDEAHGLDISQVFVVIDEDTHQPLDDFAEIAFKESPPAPETVAHWLLRRRDGKEIPIDLAIAPLHDAATAQIGVVLTFRDLTSSHRLAQQLSHQAAHDALTGLVNRREFERRLKRLIASPDPNDEHALLYLDLDQFKLVNDVCGHGGGDQLLSQIAVVLRGRMRTRDTLARLGGDEFGVLLEHCPLEDALVVAEDLRRLVQDFHFAWGGQTFRLGLSVGLASITEAGDTFEQVLGAADRACYAAKDSGRNRVHVYKSEDNAIAQRHGDMQWVGRIQTALTEGRFRLYYQPIVPIGGDNGSEPWGEVLLRLLDETGNLILPGAFLPAIERYGQMDAVDRWVIAQAFAALVDQTAKIPNARFSVNVSGRSLHSGELLDFVTEHLVDSGIAAERIGFEITETAAIANLEAAQCFISTLKSLGCRLALDDFGSGLSSFTYLKNLPVDYLKIDAGFIKTMCRDPIDRAMVESIHQISRVIGLKTIAEGVEDDATLAALRSIGVDYAQGEWIAPPKQLVH